MKDKFFYFLDKVYLFIYKFVTKIVYVKIAIYKGKKSNLTLKEKKLIKSYWKDNYNIRISLKEYSWYKKHGVNVNPRLIPDLIWHTKIEPYFSNVFLERAFKDKNYFDTILDKSNSLDTLIRCIAGELLNEEYELIDLKEALDILKKINEVIIKPTLDSGGGRNIKFVKTANLTGNSFLKIISEYNNNFIIQRVIKQNDYFKRFNESSINTIRIVSILFKGKVYILSSFLRIGGKNSRIDNVSNGGMYIPLDQDGYLKKNYFTKESKSHELKKYDATRFDFYDDKIPFWEDIKKVIIKYHSKLSHFKIINWDVTVDYNNEIKIIEYNLLESSCSSHQIANGPIFGDLTDKILDEVFNKKN